MAVRIENGRLVVLTYRLTDISGRLIEERTPADPLEYVHGSGQVLTAVERVLHGKTAGHQGEIQISAREGYGDYDAGLAVEIPRSRFPESIDLHIGMKFNTTGPNGTPLTVRITELNAKTATVDGNHPLAGIELIFDLRVLDVRAAKSSDRISAPAGHEMGDEFGQESNDQPEDQTTSQPEDEDDRTGRKILH